MTRFLEPKNEEPYPIIAVFARAAGGTTPKKGYFNKDKTTRGFNRIDFIAQHLKRLLKHW